jgi:hypothetical protein
MNHRIMCRDNITMQTRIVCSGNNEKAVREALAIFQATAPSHEFYWAEEPILEKTTILGTWAVSYKPLNVPSEPKTVPFPRGWAFV